LKPFDIFLWEPPGWREPHPAVVISHPDRAANKEMVEVLMCSSHRASRTSQPNEIILDKADGLDRPTICKCDLIYAVPRGDLKHRRGQVSDARRAPLLRALIASHGWAQAL
jgi:mRNA-degrading endonuclease toxin of MazEF toxin-antitoxin module